MKKRGISNITVVILLILVVIGMTAGIFITLRENVSENTLEIEKKIQAISAIQLRIVDVSIKDEDLYVLVENTGQQNISSFIMKVYSIKNDVYFNNSIYLPEKERLGPLHSRDLIIIPAPFGNKSENYSRVEVYPRFEFNKKEEIAESASDTRNFGGGESSPQTSYTYYADSDGDGYGDPQNSITTRSTAPGGYVSNNLDCNDSNSAVNPDAKEICDSIDNNCNNQVDELNAGCKDITPYCISGSCVSGQNIPLILPEKQGFWDAGFANFSRVTSDKTFMHQYRSNASSTVLGWSENYFLNGYVTMYEATGNTSYFDEIIEDFDIMLNNRSDKLGISDPVHNKLMPAWGDSRILASCNSLCNGVSTCGKYFNWLVHNGNIVMPIARMIYLVRRDSLSQYYSKTDFYLGELEKTFNAFEQDWRQVNEDEGYYFTNYSCAALPWNQQHSFGAFILNLYLAAGNQTYKNKVENMANYFKHYMNFSGYTPAQPGAYVWGYYSYPTVGRAEDFAHASLTVDWMFQSYRAGIVFNLTDMQALIKTFQGCTKKYPDGKINWTGCIDGTNCPPGYNLKEGGNEAMYWGELGFFNENITRDIMMDRDSKQYPLATAYYSEISTQFKFDEPIDSNLEF